MLQVANSSSQNFGITLTIILRISYLYNLNRLDFKNYDGALFIIDYTVRIFILFRLNIFILKSIYDIIHQ